MTLTADMATARDALDALDREHFDREWVGVILDACSDPDEHTTLRELAFMLDLVRARYRHHYELDGCDWAEVVRGFEAERRGPVPGGNARTDMIGRVFGELEVIGEAESKRSGGTMRRRVRCRCRLCGCETIKGASQLRQGKTNSCGAPACRKRVRTCPSDSS